jgi:hypothetical protein
MKILKNGAKIETAIKTAPRSNRVGTVYHGGECLHDSEENKELPTENTARLKI